MGRKPYLRLAFASVIGGLLIAGALLTTFTLAHESDGAPIIMSPTDGAVVGSPVTIIVGFETSGMMHDEDTKHATNVAPKQMGQMGQKEQTGHMGEMHGDEQHHDAHLHVIIDSPLPKSGMMVPMDEKHIHLMHGETKTVARRGSTRSNSSWAARIM
jgi:hypothetical protein